MSQTMLAAQFNQFGEPTEVINTQQVAIPTPGADQVLVRMILSPIHNHDLWIIRGSYGYKPELPAIGGSEAVGEIVAVGKDVNNVQVGQRIAVANIKEAWAEYFVAPAAAVVPVPDTLSDESAAQLIAMPFSCATLLDFLQVKAGQWIILNAASGMVGKTTAMLGKAKGINVINIVRRDAAVAELKALGLDYVVSTEQADWQEQVKDILGDNEAVTGVDSIGGQAATDLANLLGYGATFVSFGTMGDNIVPIPVGTLIFKQLQVKGFWGAIVSEQMPTEKKRILLGELITLVAQGKLKLEVDSIYPLSQAQEACAASLVSGKRGKILIKGSK